jgi:hypothetical protein
MTLAAERITRMPIVDAQAPPERLAMLRVLTGVFTLGYLMIRLPVFLQLGERESGFDGVGIANLLAGPVSQFAVTTAIVATLASGVAYTLGWHFKVAGPLFALALVALTSYRSSWGQLLHFENLFVLHVAIVGLAPSADAWSLSRARPQRDPTSYGWPVGLAALVTVSTYVIAGIAKLRYGGIDWGLGDTLRNHVAYSAARLELLGGEPAPLAAWGVRNGWIWPYAGVLTVVIELSAPIALLGGRRRTAWVIAAWLMHAGILAFMLIGFPYPLALIAFAPLFRVERLWTERPRWARGRTDQLAS